MLVRLHLCRVKFVLVLFSVLFVCFSCQHTDDTLAIPLYFDLPGYIQGEIRRQNAKAQAVVVHWEKDGQVEQKTGQQIDWKKALAALEKLDLNRTAYRGSYQVDSSQYGEQLNVKYRASGASVKPQTLHMVKEAGRIVRLEVTVADENFLYTSQTHYTYVPDDTLSISGTQRVIFGKTHSYKRSYWY